MGNPVLDLFSSDFSGNWRLFHVQEIPEKTAKGRRKIGYGLGDILCIRDETFMG